MRSPAFITLNLAGVALFAALSAAPVSALTKVAILTPDASKLDQEFSDKLAAGISGSRISVTDPDLALSAYRSAAPETPFNMTSDAARRLGAVIGSDFLLLLKAVVQRRNSSEKGDHFEAYAVTYLISSRTGRLVDWKLRTFEDPKASAAEQRLIVDAVSLGYGMAKRIETAARGETVEASSIPTMEEPPEPDSPLAKNFKAPIPFRRIKPEYTSLAAFYEIASTVEIVIDLDSKGQIMRTEIVRWAGYGLDESVEKAVREMNWRPAERDGKFLPMRFLVRYNFKKIDKTN